MTEQDNYGAQTQGCPERARASRLKIVSDICGLAPQVVAISGKTASILVFSVAALKGFTM